MYENEKNELRSYLKAKRKARAYRDKIDELEKTINAMKGPSFNEHISGGSVITKESQIAKLVDYQMEWFKLQAEAERKCLEINKKIEKVNEVNQDCGLILVLRFINGCSFERICISICKEYRQMFRDYNKALEIYQRVNKEVSNETRRT